MSEGMETFEARLASFDTVLNPAKRRGSSAKSIKPITWPHSSPSPAELAHAGFYYEPHETNPDNTRCFLCESALDGWEEEDNPLTEHLTLAPNCGWAIMMDIQRRTSNPAEIEDPTSDRIVQARNATFGLFWPYDGKRGWECQSEKMVAGGWYFCANEESNDLASCAYCKLSLDGWEPKDDPFEEHYRRSSDCSFFVFAQHPSKKTKSSRSKKPRSSKASSRLSTQSTASEAPTDDFDDFDDQSIMSDTSTKPKNTKKSTKSRSKASKSKKADMENEQMDIEDASPEPPKPKRATRGKKRTSDQIDQGDFDGTDIEATEASARAPKKRATRTRGSASRQNSVDIDDAISIASQDEATPVGEEPKKGRRSTKKAFSTKGRKASGASSTSKEPSKEPSKSRVPDDEELDAALEAGLEHDAHDYEEQPAEKTTKQASKKSKSNNKKTKTETETAVDTKHAPTSRAESPEDREEEAPQIEQVEPVETESRAQAKTSKATSKRKVKGSKAQEAEPESRASPDEREDTVAAVPERHESVVSEAESVEEVKTKKSKKASADKTKKSKKSPKEEVSEPKEDPIEGIENALEQEPAEEDIDMPDLKEEAPESPAEKYEKEVEDRSSRRRSSNHPPKTVERYSDMPHEQQFAKSLTESQGSGSHGEYSNTRHPDRHDHAVSPIPYTSRSTPSLSPQSSDAENQPPSAKPSTTRDHAPSPSKQPSEQAPLAVNNTPSPSKQNANTGGVKSSQPWTPINIEAILFGADSEKENAGRPVGELSSAEKQMTVEEWIQWQAKNGEERLKKECERLVSHFEKEGGRAMRVLESIECID